jgi:hypothetical protein
MDWREMHHNARMRMQPCPSVLTVMCPRMVTDERHSLDGRGHLRVQVLQARDELTRPLARMTWAIDLSGTGVERRQQIPRPGPLICVRHAMGELRFGRPRGMAAWPRWQGGLLIHAKHTFVVSQGPRVEVHDGCHTPTALRWWRQGFS